MTLYAWQNGDARGKTTTRDVWRGRDEWLTDHGCAVRGCGKGGSTALVQAEPSRSGLSAAEASPNFSLALREFPWANLINAISATGKIWLIMEHYSCSTNRQKVTRNTVSKRIMLKILRKTTQYTFSKISNQDSEEQAGWDNLELAFVQQLKETLKISKCEKNKTNLTYNQRTNGNRKITFYSVQQIF